MEPAVIDASLTVSANAPATAPPPHATGQPGFFDELLSELNPLQYVPVIGTIYRAVTGDTIPESARFAGSLVVSGLLGGPVGIAINVGTTMVEHLLGIDQEAVGNDILARLGIGPGAKASVAVVGGSPSAAVAGSAAPTSPAPAPTASGPATAAAGNGWSPAQLAAYGVGQTTLGVLVRGRERGADVFNSLELARLASMPS